MTRTFSLYFYVANYRLDSIRVVLRDGYVEYGQDDLKENGELRQTQWLIKFLDIHTVIEPEEIPNDYQGTFRITLTLQAEVDSVPRSPKFGLCPRSGRWSLFPFLRGSINSYPI